MRFENVQVIYFSPTGTSKCVVQAIVEGLEVESNVSETDLTRPGFTPCAPLGTNDLALSGADAADFEESSQELQVHDVDLEYTGMIKFVPFRRSRTAHCASRCVLL